jgi:hypothetical protein
MILTLSFTSSKPSKWIKLTDSAQQIPELHIKFNLHSKLFFIIQFEISSHVTEYDKYNYPIIDASSLSTGIIHNMQSILEFYFCAK